jgi:DNA-binding CsgD family transcriptional regulator
MYGSPEEPGPILTPREWQVLELLRRGFADHQVAQVLGISEGEARRHASSLLSKLSLSREQVGGWQPVQPPTPASLPTARPHRPHVPAALKFAAGALGVIIIAAVGAVALALLTGDNDRATAPNGDGVIDGPGSIQRPLIGDHWHAAYEIVICGEKQPNIPTFVGNIHTHADGFIHIHPMTAEEEGLNARLVKFFEYAGGVLTNDTLQMPGSDDVYTTGDICTDGRASTLRVTVNDIPLQDVTQYTPQDGDQILISFGP